LEAALGPDHAEVVALRRVEVRLLVNTSRFEEAVAGSRRVVDSYTRSRGADDPETAMALVVQAMALIELGRFDEAQGVLRDSVARLERSRGPDHAQLVYPFMHLTTLLKRSGRTAEALLANERVLALQGKHLGSEHVLVGRVLADRGDLLRQLGRFEESGRAMDAAGRILEPLANQELGILMLYRGRLAMAQLRFAEAERAFARAESIYRATLGDSALDPWGARADRGAALARLGRREEGGRMLQEALAAIARLAGPDSEAHAEVAGKLEEARRLKALPGR
jgi:tetratricopeptide (TPR) repeat protein